MRALVRALTAAPWVGLYATWLWVGYRVLGDPTYSYGDRPSWEYRAAVALWSPLALVAHGLRLDLSLRHVAFTWWYVVLRGRWIPDELSPNRW